ncbi:MAG: aldo/keto reductase [Rhodospirillales bacterium]|nr:aldo/keto reductase [Rhodospirillales bacterium]
MKPTTWQVTRRALLGSLAALGLVVSFARPSGSANTKALSKAIPKTGELLPAIGMGSWLTFSVNEDEQARAVRTQVLKAFFKAGGGMIDSSPMYGSSEEVIGYALARIADTRTLFSATKVWTPLQWHGRRQMAASEKLWGENRFDLFQIHNLLSWESHLETLLEAKASGRVRYIGVTTSHGRKHDELEKIMAEKPIDFVQFTYNVIDREAEQRLLRLAAEHRLAVIINRPFQGGGLFDRFQHHSLPPWAATIDCANWAQFFLKFIVSHPAVTCTIPATSQVSHMRENMGAGLGRLPSPETRQRMIRYVEDL